MNKLNAEISYFDYKVVINGSEISIVKYNKLTDMIDNISYFVELK